jgi:hypothetical protein
MRIELPVMRLASSHTRNMTRWATSCIDLWILDDADVPQEFHRPTKAAEAFEKGAPEA